MLPARFFASNPSRGEELIELCFDRRRARRCDRAHTAPRRARRSLAAPRCAAAAALSPAVALPLLELLLLSCTCCSCRLLLPMAMSACSSRADVCPGRVPCPASYCAALRAAVAAYCGLASCRAAELLKTLLLPRTVLRCCLLLLLMVMVAVILRPCVLAMATHPWLDVEADPLT